MTKTVNVIHKQRTNTAANWSASNPILLAGQIGVVSGTSPTRFKVGMAQQLGIVFHIQMKIGH